eukprot:CAMPEP_0194120330 /NCGR_PEP_ID=MMETSP0150-20130528/43070_1 /TAXON_ID=122233 /ORGANISM="Chaetoceros debilis, Strain MM31A-1" /LENGTH=539 /DNA_ID=CAMNT_0038812401 /DNA_START=1 /DNA_END=1617 /DNA_ORIENTATION=-
MPRIKPTKKQYDYLNSIGANPYNSDDEENFSQSQSSLPSFQSSRSGLSLSQRREMSSVFQSRDKLMLAEMQLDEERRRGRCMLFACIVLSVFCMALFKDRWPDDIKKAIIDLLDDGTRNTAPHIVPGSTEEFINHHSSTTMVAPVAQSSSGGEAPEDEDDSYTSSSSLSSVVYYKNEDMAVLPKKNEDKGNDSNNEDVADQSNATVPVDVDFREGIRPPVTIVPEPTEEQKQKNKEEAIMEELQQHLDNLSKYLKWNLPYKPDRDVPVYWAIPLTGTDLLDRVMAKCYDLVQATDQVNLISGHEEEKILNVVTEDDGSKYMNVNLGNLSGVKRAQELRLASSGSVDVIRSSYLYEIALLFQSTAKYGKCFTMVRNPIERSIDVFRKLKATSENPVFQSMTLEEYTNSPYSEDNWMVRFLSNEMEGKLDEHHLDLAKHVLGRKCFIGLTENFAESIRRFAAYFNWDQRYSGEIVNQCMVELNIMKHLNEGDVNLGSMGPAVPKETYAEGTKIYKTLTKLNAMDTELYKYSIALFNRQSLY